MPKSRSCSACGKEMFQENWTHSHKVRKEDLNELKKRHCDPKRKADLKVGMHICCRHFESPHLHTKQKVPLGKVPAKNLPTVKLLPKKKKKKKGRPKELKRILKEEAEVAAQRRGSRMTRSSQSEIIEECLSFGIDLQHPVTSIFQIHDALSVTVPSENTWSSDQVRALLQVVLKKGISQQQLKFDSFSLYRKDLYAWTGFKKIKEMEDLYLTPLFEYYKDPPKMTGLPKSEVPIRDRVLWVFIYMWTDLSLLSLYQQLIETRSLPEMDVKNFKRMLRRTARDLCSAVEGCVQLPSFDEWLERNQIGANMEVYNQVDKTLFLILDGTSLEVFQPADLHKASRLWYTSYKKHHAWRFFVAVTTDGTISFLSPLYVGSQTDTSCYQESGLKETLEATYDLSAIPVGYKLAIGGDKGYIHAVPPTGWAIYLTQSAVKEMEKGSDQTEGDNVQEDPQKTLGYRRVCETCFAQPRAVVERSINLIKRWRKFTGGRIFVRSGDLFLSHLLMLAVVYANYLIAQRECDDDVDAEVERVTESVEEENEEESEGETGSSSSDD
jgi:hypothetical protein